jgi:dimethylamine/trimethylamine dehydrogenase
MVTSRAPDNYIYLAMTEYPDKLDAAGIKPVTAIGDCLCPPTIAAAVYDGHRVAREMDAPPQNPDMPFRREIIQLEQA